DRYSNSTALRSNFGQNVVNEARFGKLWGRSGFTLVGGPEFFTETQAGFNLGIGAAGITGATVRNAAQLRESPTNDFTDNLTWIKGSHTLTFGGQFKTIGLIDDNRPQFVPTVNFGILTTDPASSVFTTANFPGASAAQVAEAAALYATLTGRVSGYTQTGYLGASGQYVPSGPLFREVKQRTFGLFAQDTWRVRPNLTINFGVRWQPQEGYTLLSENFSRLENFDMLYDVSGPGNLFSPGTLTGQVPRVVGTKKGERAFDTDYNNFAPTIGIVWSPDFGEGFLSSVFGRTSVIRGGFGRAFVREGTILAGNTLGINPGGTLSLSRSVALQNFTTGTLLRTPGNPNLTPAPFSATPIFPRNLTGADAALAFDPDLRTGYVDSYSIGYQRELDNNTVIEFRYVGNRGKDIFRLYSLNETNTIENGFAGEFRLAQANLRANQAAGRGNSFAFFGAGTGTTPLPILLSYIRGIGDANNPAHYSATFANATLVNTLATSNPNVVGLASTLEFNFRANATAAGRPSNFINNCPTTLGFCFIVDNSETSSYDSAVIELRRRLSTGLREQASYVYAKAFTNAFAGATSFAGAAAADQNNNSSVTLRNPDLDNSPAQVDLRHAFKLDATIDLPFGRGQQFFSNSNWFVNALFGGFSIVPTLRWQSGSPFLLENVQLIGMTVEELQKEIKVRKNPTNVTYLPDDIINNTQRAFNVSATSSTGYGTQFGGAPQGRFIAPAGYGNCLARFAGECGFRKLVLYGPSFFKIDTAVIKRIQFDERRNVELRATIFDVLNKPNFRIGGFGGNFTNVTGFGAGFGELGPGTAFQDPFGSNDPGGRIIDLTLRINF
ncbi:MAG TPA: TonB-dependent receptor, partial [Pyrinomonadaceae bacterium]